MTTLAPTRTNTLQIRALVVKDLPHCLPFGHAFITEKQVPGVFSEQAFLKNWTTFLATYPSVIFGLWNGDELVGGIGGMISPDLNTGESIALEFFWYVTPAHRGGTWPIRLVERFRTWGRKRGATRFRMIHLLEPGESPSTVKLADYYTRIGLRPLEVSYDGPI